MIKNLIQGALLACLIGAIASPAFAYPPKAEDWTRLSGNAESVIGGWVESVGAVNDTSLSGNEDFEALQGLMREKFTPVNAACAAIRDQIGSGGLFGPEMWTQGFSQTCWAVASLQKAQSFKAKDKVCQETKAALNFFKSYKPKKWPEAYPLAETHIAAFTQINASMRDVMSCK